MIINEDFVPKRKKSDRLPPGQYEERGFPVLSMGPTPYVEIPDWKLTIDGLVEKPMSWNWQEFGKLPVTKVIKDIHCVTKWSKFDTKWSGVSLDDLMSMVGVSPSATHIIAHSYDGYTTNLPIEDISNGKAMVATLYDEDMIEDEHGGPARLLVPHLYFWKSAKWLNRIEFVDRDKPGFWERNGYHNYGDPWQEQRYWND
jgi:DMSO/TMAO reductase YedYZ molybdopterin-dependent catalytic subunit